MNDNFKVSVGAEIDKNAGKKIQEGLDKVVPKPIEVPFKINFKNSKEIESEMKRIVGKLTDGKGSLADYKINTSTIFDKDLGQRVEKINSAIIKYKNELGEVISEQYKFNQIGSKIDDSGQEEIIMGWSKAMSSYGQNIEQVTKKEENLAKQQAKSILKQKELVEQMKLLQIQTNKSDTTLNQDTLTGFDTANKNNNIKEMTHYLNLAKTEYRQLNAMMEKDIPISGLENMKKNIGTMPIDIQNVETSFKKLQVQPEELRTRIDQLGNSFKSLESFKGAEADKVKQYNLLKGEITGVTKEVKSLIAAQQQQISLDDKTKFSSSIISWSNDNTKGAKLFRVELERIQRELIGADKTKFTALKKEFGSIQKQTEAMGKSGRTAFQELGNNFKKFASWYGIAGITTGAVRGIKQMVSTVVELDKSFVDLQQATGFTREEAGKLLNTYIDLGQELGATGTEVAQAADIWLRQGKSIAETNDLIRSSMILSKIGQIDSAQSTQYLTSAMKGYKIEASEVLSIIDKLASVDLNSATSVGGLAEAMSRTANGARIAGVEMDKLLGMLAVVGEVSQKSMDSVGESFKTIFARMGNVKLGKFVDEDGNDITSEINDVEKVLGKVKIKLRESATEFRNFGNVLDDVGNNWSKFNEVDQNAIASAFAGVRQRESFVTLMENYGDSLKYTEISANSAGTAMEKFSSYEDSVEAKTKRLQASLQELASGTLDSGVVKGFLDLANVLVTVTDSIGVFNIALLSFFSVIGTKTGLFGNLIGQIQMLILAQTGYKASTVKAALAQVGLTGAIKATGTAIKAFMATNPIGWILAITAAIGGLFKLQDLLTVSLEEQTEKTEKLQSEYSEMETELKSLNSELKTTAERIDELNKKDSLTIVEQDELNNLKDANTELERQIRLLEQQADIKQRELADSIAEEFKKDFSDEYFSLTKFTTYDARGQKVTMPDLISESEYVNELISEYERLSKIDKSIISKEDQKKLDFYYKQLIDYGVKFDDYANRYKIKDDTSQSWRDFAKLIDKTLNPAEYTTSVFDEVFNDESFKTHKEKLIELAKAGELNPIVLKTNKDYQVLMDKTGLSALELVNHIKAIASESENVDSIFDLESFNNKLEKSNEKIKNLISEVKNLSSAFEEQAENGQLSASTILDLINSGYASALESENGMIRLNKDATIALTKAKIEDEIATQRLLKLDLEEKYKRELIALESLTNTYVRGTLVKHTDEYIRSIVGDGVFDDISESEKRLELLNKLFENIGNGNFNIDDKTPKKDKSPSSDPWKDDFERQYADLKHNLTLNKITQEEYFNSLSDLNKKYFAGRAKYIDEDRKNLEELYGIQKSLNSKLVSDMEHNLQMGINKDISEEEQISSLKALQNQVHQQAQYWRSQGLDENHEYIQELQNQWWKYHNQITDIREEAVKKAQDAVKKAFDEREKLIQGQKKSELDALEETRKADIKNLNNQIDKYKEIVNAKKESLRADKDANDYQEKLKGHTDDISKIESEITTLTKAANSGDREAMAQKRKLEEDLNKAKGDLAKTQKDHEYDLATDALDKELTAYEKMKKSETDSMESYYDYEKVKIENNYSEKLSLAKSMHDKEMKMIEQSATLMKTSYGSALNELSRIIENANLSIANSIELQSQSLLKSTNITIDADKLDQLKNSMSTIKLPSIAGSLGSSISNISNISNKSSVISPVINLQLCSGTTIDKNAINEWNKFRKDITNDVSKALMDVINTR